MKTEGMKEGGRPAGGLTGVKVTTVVLRSKPLSRQYTKSSTCPHFAGGIPRAVSMPRVTSPRWTLLSARSSAFIRACRFCSSGPIRSGPAPEELLRNTAEFERVNGLTLENWTVPRRRKR